MKSTRTYILYEGWEGEPQSDWRRCPDIRHGRYDAFPPDTRWLVVARSKKEADGFVYDSETTASRGDGLGLFWDSTEHPLPMPYGADDTVLWGLESLCGAPTLTLWKTREIAEEQRLKLDEWRCGGLCRGHHRVIPIRLAEVKRFGRVRWLWVGYTSP